MFDEFIILSTDRIVDIWNLRGGGWETDEYHLFYDNQIEMILSEFEGREFITRFRNKESLNSFATLKETNV